MLTRQAVPDGFHTATPFIMVKDAHRVIDFMRAAFGATEVFRLQHADGSVWHSQMRLGDSMIMLGDVRDKQPSMPSSIHL